MSKDNLFSWYTEAIGAEMHSITKPFDDWIAVHGMLCVALKNPLIADGPRQAAKEMVAQLVTLFKKQGMSERELSHIRYVATGGMEWLYQTVEDEGDRARRRIERLSNKEEGR